MPEAILTPTILANGRVESYTKIIFVEWLGGTVGSPVELYVSFIYDFFISLQLQVQSVYEID